MRAREKEKSLSVLIGEVDKVFSEFIRYRDMKDGKIKCFICGTSLRFSEAQNMHYIDRDQMPTRYDEMNCHAGCEECNCFDPAHKEKYEQKLRTILTPEGIDHLWAKSRGLQKFMRYEIEELIEYYSMNNSYLKKERGF